MNCVVFKTMDTDLSEKPNLQNCKPFKIGYFLI